MTATRSLTDKPQTQESLEEDGKIVAVHTTEPVVDPDAANAVQILDADQYPAANATVHDELRRLLSITPADALDPDDAGVNEEQSVTLTSAPGGTFTLSFEGIESDPIAFDASATAVRDALIGVRTIGSDGEGNPNVTVTGDPGGPYTVTFVGDHAAKDVPALVADASGIEPLEATAAVVETTPGAP